MTILQPQRNRGISGAVGFKDSEVCTLVCLVYVGSSNMQLFPAHVKCGNTKLVKVQMHTCVHLLCERYLCNRRRHSETQEEDILSGLREDKQSVPRSARLHTVAYEC